MTLYHVFNEFLEDVLEDNLPNDATGFKQSKDNYVNNPIVGDRLNYDVLYHTDLSRKHEFSNGLDLDRLNWGNYDLIVIDESHNFSNGYGTHANIHENRYSILMEKVIQVGVRTKVLMLSATPVNNQFADLRNQIALAYEGKSSELSKKLGTDKTIEEIFKQAQRAFNTWSKLPAKSRVTENLLKTLDFDFFRLLDSVTIARSRKHIEKYYDTTEIRKFPKRLKPISVRSTLSDLKMVISFKEIYEIVSSLNLAIYTPSLYIFESKIEKYNALSHNKGNMTQHGREQGIRKLMSINLLKRLENSVNSFTLTMGRIRTLISDTIKSIDSSKKLGKSKIDMYDISEDDFDLDDTNTDFIVGKKVQIDLVDMDLTSWKEELIKNLENVEIMSTLTHWL